jgi:hypothetical protein
MAKWEKPVIGPTAPIGGPPIAGPQSNPPPGVFPPPGVIGIGAGLVVVPNVIGLSSTAAEAELDALLLRHITSFPFDASRDGSAAQQSPVGGHWSRRIRLSR